MAKRKPIYLMRDLAIVALSVIIAVVLAKTGILKDLLTATQTLKFVGSFVAGIFFVSIFTAAPATVVLIELLRANTIIEVALFGGLGALIGDLIIFRFIKDAFAEDVRYLLEKSKIRWLMAIFKLGFVRWLAPLIGALMAGTVNRSLDCDFAVARRAWIGHDGAFKNENFVIYPNFFYS